MQNSIVLSDVFGICRRRSYFPLSLARLGNRRPYKLEHIARRRVCPVSNDGAPKVSVRVSDQLPTTVGNAIGLRGFDIAKQSL